MKRTAKLCFLFLILALMVLVAFLSVPRTTYAHAAQEEMTVTQSGSVAYGSKLYIGSTRNFVKFGTTDYNNELFDSLSFCLGNAAEKRFVFIRFAAPPQGLSWRRSWRGTGRR